MTSRVGTSPPIRWQGGGADGSQAHVQRVTRTMKEKMAPHSRHPAEVPAEVALAREEYRRSHPVRPRSMARRSMGGKRDGSATADMNLMAGGAAAPSERGPVKRSTCQTSQLTERMKARLLLLMGQDGDVTDEKVRQASAMTKLRMAETA